VSIQIQSYQYYTFSSRDSTNPPSAVILLYDVNGTWVAALWFVKDPGALPAASQAGAQYILAYSYADLPVIVDMLRNEAPVSLIVDPQGLVENWRISTSAEPVGEGEH
jgi:hypothetical protein